MRIKSKQIVFNYPAMPQAGIDMLKNSKDEQNRPYDYEYDGNEGVHKLYLHYDNNEKFRGFDRELLTYKQYIVDFINTVKPKPYLDMYIQVTEIPEDAEFVENETGIWKNVTWDDMQAGKYSFDELLMQKEVTT